MCLGLNETDPHRMLILDYNTGNHRQGVKRVQTVQHCEAVHFPKDQENACPCRNVKINTPNSPDCLLHNWKIGKCNKMKRNVKERESVSVRDR